MINEDTAGKTQGLYQISFMISDGIYLDRYCLKGDKIQETTRRTTTLNPVYINFKPG